MSYARKDIEPVLRPVRRWTEWRKTLLLAAIRQNIITEEKACALHNISAEELARWRELEQVSLKATEVQRFR